jgi:hypothetical protein
MPAARENRGAKRSGVSIGGQFAPDRSGIRGVRARPEAPTTASPYEVGEASELADIDICTVCEGPILPADEGACQACEQAAYEAALSSSLPDDVLERALAEDATAQPPVRTVSEFELPPELDTTVSSLARAVVDGDPAAAADLRAQLTEQIARLPVQAIPAPFSSDPVDPAELPHTAGIYIITGPDASYVGLAKDIHQRFYNRDYGHLTENNHCRSRFILDGDDYEIRVIPVDASEDGREAQQYALAEAEIRAYAQLHAAGHYPNNALATLGRVGDGKVIPIVACDLATGEYTFYESTMAATRDTGSTSIAAALHGYQRIAAGRVVRWATFGEQELLLDKTDRAGKLTGEIVTKALSIQPRSVDWGETREGGRGADFSWSGGALAADDITTLRPYVRGVGSYNKNRPTSGYYGVRSLGDESKWEVRIKTGPGPRDAITKTFADAHEAAVYRESYITDNGLQAYNNGVGASNADALNFHFGARQFTGWDSSPGRRAAADGAAAAA